MATDKLGHSNEKDDFDYRLNREISQMRRTEEAYWLHRHNYGHPYPLSLTPLFQDYDSGSGELFHQGYFPLHAAESTRTQVESPASTQQGSIFQRFFSYFIPKANKNRKEK